MSIGAQQNRWGDGKANSEVPLQMQLLESDFIDSYRDGVPPSTNRQFKARDNAALAFDFSLHHLWNDLSRLLHTRLHLPSPNLATRLRLTTALAVRLHRAFAGRPFLKPIAICLQCQGKILANTAIPNPKGGRNGNVRQGQTRPHKEFAVAEFIPKSVHGALEPGLDSDCRPIAFLIVRRTEADRKKGCH